MMRVWKYGNKVFFNIASSSSLANTNNRHDSLSRTDDVTTSTTNKKAFSLAWLG